MTDKVNPRLKGDTDKRKIDIPKEFIKKIKKLGMKVEDAEILYKSKIDWSVIYSENKIYCAELGCVFFTKIDSEELTNHMINVHHYGDYPCDDDHCGYVAHSEVKICPLVIFQKIVLLQPKFYLLIVYK